MNGNVIIVREGKIGGIIMTMKVIIVAIYLCRADVVAHSWPLCSPLRLQMICPSNIHALIRTYAHMLHARSHIHRLQFIHWLAATARHLSRQLAADTRELRCRQSHPRLHLMPLYQPPPSSPSTLRKTPRHHPTAALPPRLFSKSIIRFVFPSARFHTPPHGVLLPPLHTHKRVYPRSVDLIDRCDEKYVIGSSVRWLMSQFSRFLID